MQTYVNTGQQRVHACAILAAASILGTSCKITHAGSPMCCCNSADKEGAVGACRLYKGTTELVVYTLWDLHHNVMTLTRSPDTDYSGKHFPDRRPETYMELIVYYKHICNTKPGGMTLASDSHALQAKSCRSTKIMYQDPGTYKQTLGQTMYKVYSRAHQQQLSKSDSSLW